MNNSIYEIRFARLDEIGVISDFLRDYWSPTHALVKSPALMDFMYKDKDHYNWIVGYNKESKRIDGIWGIVPTYIYDEKLKDSGDYWGALLKVNKDVDNEEVNKLAIYLFGYCRRIPKKSYCSVGLGPLGQAFMNPFYKHRGYLNQYYIANNSLNVFNVALNPILNEYPETDFKIKTINLFDIKEEPICFYSPRKSLTFFINRFAKHPIYKYGFWGVYDKGDNLLCIFAFRKIRVEGKGAVLRIVDCLGDLNSVGCIGRQFQQILKQESAEYVDCLNSGIDDAVFKKMGFEKLDLDGTETIIPNYFEPYEQENVKIFYAYNGGENFTIFKADADQDRPNLV